MQEIKPYPLPQGRTHTHICMCVYIYIDTHTYIYMSMCTPLIYMRGVHIDTYISLIQHLSIDGRMNMSGTTGCSTQLGQKNLLSKSIYKNIC